MVDDSKRKLLYIKLVYEKNPIKSSLYTGVTYIFTVAFLVSPYFIAKNIFVALSFTLIIAIIIIAFYTFYMTIAKSQKFLPRFLEIIFFCTLNYTPTRKK